MNDVTIELSVEDAFEEQALQQAVDDFARWREGLAEVLHADGEAPDLIVKTSWSSDGKLGKTLIFQDPNAAHRFMAIWREHKKRAA